MPSFDRLQAPRDAAVSQDIAAGDQESSCCDSHGLRRGLARESAQLLPPRRRTFLRTKQSGRNSRHIPISRTRQQQLGQWARDDINGGSSSHSRHSLRRRHATSSSLAGRAGTKAGASDRAGTLAMAGTMTGQWQARSMATIHGSPQARKRRWRHAGLAFSKHWPQPWREAQRAPHQEHRAGTWASGGGGGAATRWRRAAPGQLGGDSRKQRNCGLRAAIEARRTARRRYALCIRSSHRSRRRGSSWWSVLRLGASFGRTRAGWLFCNLP
jgi:hypothetical protein